LLNIATHQLTSQNNQMYDSSYTSFGFVQNDEQEQGEPTPPAEPTASANDVPVPTPSPTDAGAPH
jgi:hypothetical protein